MRSIKVTVKNIHSVVAAAAEALRAGQVIVYPTETFYGLGCDATNKLAVASIFKIKGRDDKKALPVIVSSLAMLKKYFLLNLPAQNLIKKYQPGPLSLVLNFSEYGKKAFGKSINKKSFDGGARISSHKVAAVITKKLGRPLVSTSANPSGRPAASDAQAVINYFKNKKFQPDIIIDAGKLPPSKGSTFVDVRDGGIKVLRQGDVIIK